MGSSTLYCRVLGVKLFWGVSDNHITQGGTSSAGSGMQWLWSWFCQVSCLKSTGSNERLTGQGPRQPGNTLPSQEDSVQCPGAGQTHHARYSTRRNRCFWGTPDRQRAREHLGHHPWAGLCRRRSHLRQQGACRSDFSSIQSGLFELFLVAF